MKPLRNFFTVTFLVFCIASSFAQSLVGNTQDNTSCGAPNGTASASVDGSTLDYTFRWYQGSDITGSLLAEQPDIVNLQAGIYTVTATHNATAALVGPVSVMVQNNVTLPVVSIDVLAPYTSCVSPNGSLRAEPDGPAGDYSYAWYYGSLPLGQGGQTATGLQSGFHTVRVTHNLTQCQTIASATVPNESVFPSVSINILSHLTSCTSPNGSVQAVPGGSASDYTYAWYRGPVAQGTVLSTGQTLSQLTADAYTVQTTHKSATQCKATATVNIQDNRPTFSASVQVLSNVTSCTSPNGALKAIPSAGSASSYTYKWYAGTAPQGTLISTSQTLSNRAPGIYTVLIRHKTSFCETVVSGTIQNQTPVGSVTVQVLAPSTSCSSNNGALTVVAPGSLANYTYAWYEGAAATGPVLSNGPQVYVLAAGIHTVVVTHIATQCKATINAIVPDERVIPVVSVNVLSNETSCASPNGSLEAVVAQGLPEDYSYSWFAGTTTGGPVLSTDATISGLSAGTYTVVVVNNFSQCESQISAVVQDEKVFVSLFVTVVSNQTSCALPNGALQAVVEGPYSDYTFAWYNGGGASGPVLGNTPVIDLLPAGIYTVVVTHNNSQCQAVISAMVPEDITPTVAYIQVQSNTSCTVPNGQLIAVPQGAVGDYFYEWYAGSTPYISPILSVNHWVASLPAGTYVVVITHKTTGCVLWVNAEVLDECQQSLMSAASTGNDSQELSYYPNPVNGTLWISPGREGSITISNFTGKVIRRQKLRGTDQTVAVDLSDQPAGMYILTFTSGTGTSRYHIMKQ